MVKHWSNKAIFIYNSCISFWSSYKNVSSEYLNGIVWLTVPGIEPDVLSTFCVMRV